MLGLFWIFVYERVTPRHSFNNVGAIAEYPGPAITRVGVLWSKLEVLYQV